MLHPASPTNPPVAGVMALPEAARAAGAPAHWGAYIGVASLAETLAAALALGARFCMPEMEIPGIGRIATLQDPEGAPFALFQPAAACPAAACEDTPAPAMGQAGHFAWAELRSPAGGKALGFYGALFGWQAGPVHEIEMAGSYQLFAAGAEAQALGGMMGLPQPGMPAHWMYYVFVEDIDTTAARIAAAGGTVLAGPHEVPGGAWIIQASDPQGAGFAAVGMRAG
ncbi:MAG: VOC family protein [Rhodospirillales bacterium]|nr:VOC family protein [Rhodospirillales bacterium]